MASTVYGNPAQGYAAPPGAKIDVNGYVEGSQQGTEMAAKLAANPQLQTGYSASTPTGGGFVGGTSTPVKVTPEGVSVGGGAPVPQTPNTPVAPNSNVPLTPAQQSVTNTYNGASGQINQSIQERVSAGFASKQGTPAPYDSATGLSQASKATPPNLGATPGEKIANDLASTDPFIKQIQQTAQDYFNPVNQRASLTEEYKKLLASSGVEALDTELLNMKNVIEGSEDDLRNEITKAGGFATDSQVMALTNARNKQLIKNYNNFLETRNTKQKYLDTMLDLTAEDRKEADRMFDSKMDIGFKLADYQQKMAENAKQSYQKIADKMGYDALYNSAAASGDPAAVSRIEKQLGMDPGGLAQLSELAAKDRKLSEESDKLDIQQKKASIANTYSQIADRTADNTPISGVDAKTFAKVQSAPEYKTMTGVLPALQAIKAYSDAVEKYGTTEHISGEGEGTLKGTYGNALAAWKTLAGLGALSGADFGLAENVVPEPSFWKRTSKTQAQLKAGMDNALQQAENLTKRLGENYPAAKPLLEKQLADIKIQTAPKLTESEIKAMDKALEK